MSVAPRLVDRFFVAGNQILLPLDCLRLVWGFLISDLILGVGVGEFFFVV